MPTGASSQPPRPPGARGAGRGASWAGRLPLLLLGLLVLLLAWPAPLRAEARHGDRIVNRAVQKGHDFIPPDASEVTIIVVERTPAVLEFQRYFPGGDHAIREILQTTAYHPAGADTAGFLDLPPPVLITGETLALAELIPLEEAALYHQGDPLLILLEDLDQNLDFDRAETVLVTVSCTETGDREVLRLTETGPDTGRFSGYLQTSGQAGQPGDGRLAVLTDCEVLAEYRDLRDDSDVATDTALVDPYGTVFDSRTGERVNGAEVTLVNADTGEPAEVFGDDGVSSYPATVISGSIAVDGGGTEYNFPPGGFRFPLIAPGNYRLVVRPAPGHLAPSEVATEELMALPGGPFTIREPGSRGEVFRVNPEPSIKIDFPLDPIPKGLLLQKTAGKTLVAPGDFLPYRLQVRNTDDAVEARELAVTDRLPRGFRYQQGSCRIDGRPTTDPEISADGRTLLFSPGELPPGQTLEIRYVTEVGAGTETGEAVNRAVARAQGEVRSNEARAAVRVREDLLRSHAILVGRVLVGSCDQEEDARPGLAGAGLFLEDGTYVLTDEEGRFHIEGLRPGTHVVQLDLESLPAGLAPVACEENSRSAGRSFSRFIDVQGGTLWRTDFHVAPEAPVTRDAAPPPSPAAGDGFPGGGPGGPAAVPTPHPGSAGETAAAGMGPGPAAPPPPGTEAVSPGDVLPDGPGFLHPREGMSLHLDTHAVRFRMESGLKPLLLVDGREVSEERIGFRMADPATGLTLYSYLGVQLGKPGVHTLTVRGLGPFGNARFEQSVRVIRTGEPASLQVLEPPENFADGRTPVRARLLVRDASGHPLTSGLTLELRSGDLRPLQEAGEEALDSLARSAVVRVDDEGLAHFAPVAQSGLYRAVLGYGDLEAEVELYVKPDLRDWILVGLAEGTVGYNTLHGEMEEIPDGDIDEDFYEDGRVAFYAKGRVRGEWLLTLAYDSDKPERESLFETIDPDRYYTLYGDGTEQRYDAASSRDLYVKLERDQFYALFGDYDTGLTVTELGRYSRRFNGLKAEFFGRRLQATAFASDTDQTFVKDEIPGDGTSGLYRLSRREIVSNSEEVRIEVRDRFRSEIILTSRELQRHVDYEIDYDEGTLFFKEPIPSRDQDLNHVFIVVDFEALDSRDTAVTFGGRAAVKPTRNLEIGATAVNEGRPGDDGRLFALDALWRLTPETSLRAEAATSETSFGEDSQEGSALLLEILHRSQRFDLLAHFRQLEAGFGLEQQNRSERGSRKFGLDGRYSLTSALSLQGIAYRQEDLDTDSRRDVLEVRTQLETERMASDAGLRFVEDRAASGDKHRSLQAFGGTRWKAARRLDLRLRHEQSLLGLDESSGFPTRTIAGADFRLNRRATLFAEQEFTWGEEADTATTRAGVTTNPWTGGEVYSTLEREFDEDGTRVFASTGLRQSWQINPSWSVDGSLDRSQTLKADPAPRLFPEVPPASGGDEDFTAASLGARYRNETWTWDGRVEARDGDLKDKLGLASGLFGEPRPGLGLSARLRLFLTRTRTGAEQTDGELRFGLVRRPLGSRWTLLDRLDLLLDRDRGGELGYNNWRVVNNLNLNYKAGPRTQVAFQYGAKYVSENIDGTSYDGFTDLYGLEARYDLSSRWDLGLRGSALHSWNSGQLDYSAGAAIGRQVMENIWVSLGYNLWGFEDEDFSAAAYTARGPYLKFRAKFDQSTVGRALQWLQGS